MDHNLTSQTTKGEIGSKTPAAAEAPSKTRKGKTAVVPLTPPQQELAVRFLPLARSLARPLKQMFRHWTDDFESAACLALVEAARSFDPSRNIQFATFARFRIRGALYDVGRSMSLAGWDGDHANAPGVVRLTPLNEEFGILRHPAMNREVGAEVDAADAVEEWLRKLPRKHAEVCRRCYLDGKTQAAVAEELGVSQSEVTRLHRQSLDLLSEPYRATGEARLDVRRRSRRPASTRKQVASLAV